MSLRIRMLRLEAEGDADLIGQVLGAFVRRGMAAQAAVDAAVVEAGEKRPQKIEGKPRTRRGVKGRTPRGV